MEFNFEFSLSVLNHLGRGLYRSFATVIAEAISNSWDADAESVHIEIKQDSLVIWDNGTGMDADDLQNKFLKIGYRRRNETQTSKLKNRPVLGRKGIGKLAYLSIAEEVIVITKKKENEDVISVVMDNGEIDKDVDEDRDIQESKLPELSDAELKEYRKIQESGTQLVFKRLKKRLIRHNIRAILAAQFHFSNVLKDGDKFEIFVDGDQIGIKDLARTYGAGQFAWFFSENSKKKFIDDMKEAGVDKEFVEHNEEPRKKFIDDMKETGVDKEFVVYRMIDVKSEKFDDINGYIMSVQHISKLLVHKDDKESRASVALFATGRMRESDFIAKITKAQLPENYLFGQIHVDSMDNDEEDIFTSARDGIKEDNELYVDFKELMGDVLGDIIDDWRKWRGRYGDEDHDEPKDAQARLEKKSDNLFMQWLRDSKLVSRAEYSTHPLTKYIRYMANKNVPSYMECFVAENLMRYYILNKHIDYSRCNSLGHRQSEGEVLDEEGDPIVIRVPLFGTENDDISYLSSRDMTSIIDDYNRSPGEQETEETEYFQTTSLEKYPKTITHDDNHHRPLRNAVMHTSLLTDKAKLVADTGWGIIIKKISKWLKGKS